MLIHLWCKLDGLAKETDPCVAGDVEIAAFGRVSEVNIPAVKVNPQGMLAVFEADAWGMTVLVHVSVEGVSHVFTVLYALLLCCLREGDRLPRTTCPILGR